MLQNHVIFLQKMHFPLKMVVETKKVIVPSESAPHELSNEWSSQYVSTIFNVLGTVSHPGDTFKS
jgi:hypothetical protein